MGVLLGVQGQPELLSQSQNKQTEPRVLELL